MDDRRQQLLRPGPVEGVRTVDELAVDAAVVGGAHGYRIVPAVVRDPHGAHDERIGGFGRERRAGVVLEHHDRVERSALPGELVDLRQPDVLMRHHRDLTLLQVRQHVEERFTTREAGPDRQRVHEQADHGLDSGDLGRTPRHGGAEDHVVPARQPGQEQRPDPLEEGVHRDAVPARELHQPTAQIVGEFEPDAFGLDGRGDGVRRHDVARLVEPGELGPPRLPGGFLVLAGEPGEIAAVRGGGGQGQAVTARFVGRHHVDGEDREGPSVAGDVVGGEGQPGAAFADAHQVQAQQRGPVQVEPVGMQLLRQSLELRQRLVLGQMGQVGLCPGQRHLTCDRLHGLAGPQLMETRPQGGVPVEEGLPGGAEAGDVQRAVEGEGADARVDIRASLVNGVEQQALLERRERPDVGEARNGGLDLLHVPLRQRDEEEVGGGVPANSEGGVRGEAGQQVQPGPAERLRIGFAEDPSGPGHGQLELGSIRGVEDDGVDLYGVAQRRVLLRRAADGPRHLPGLRIAVGAGGEAAQVVEPDLRLRQRRQGRCRLGVQVAQHPVAEAAVGHGSHVLLDLLQQAAGRLTTGDGLVGVDPRHVQPERVDVREPADRPREIQLSDGPAAMAFDVHHDGVAAAPSSDRARQGGQEHFVDTAVEGRGGLLHEHARAVSGQGP